MVIYAERKLLIFQENASLLIKEIELIITNSKKNVKKSTRKNILIFNSGNGTFLPPKKLNKTFLYPLLIKLAQEELDA